MSSSLGKKLTGLALFIALSATGAFANTLSEVQINPAETGYAIVLKTETPAQMKKVVTSSDKMTIELKNVIASEDLSTVYNDVSNVDNVTIQPVSKEDLKISLKGKNISSSKIYFEEAKTLPTLTENEESIELSGPVDSYSPVYSGKMLVQEDQTANPQVNEALTKMNIDRNTVVNIKELVKKQDSKSLGMLAVFVFLAIAGFAMFRPKKDTQRPVQVGLSGSLKNPALQREVSLARSMGSPASLNSKYPSASAHSNYGMKAYQQSQRNPYMTNHSSEHRAGISGIPRKSSSVQRKPAPVSAPLSVPKKPAVQTAQSPIRPTLNTLPQAQMQMQRPETINLDSMKFLESITKIYEKNGREDLAKGLKDNLKKAKMVKMPI